MRLAPLLSIKDLEGREVLFLGVDRRDLVFRLRSRAEALRLDAPDIRAPGAERLEGGSVLSVTVKRTPDGHCIEVQGWARCGLGFTIGAGWRFIVQSQGLPQTLDHPLRILWVSVMAFPAGYWARPRWESLVAMAVLLSGLLVPPFFTPLLPTPIDEFAAALAALVVGAATRRHFRRL
jgi:hypothetical protein